MSRNRRRPWSLLAALLAALGAAPLQAQPAAGDFPLEGFIREVAYLWSAGDVSAIVGLLPSAGEVLLDTGSGSEAVEGRHAAAALRDLFDDRSTSAARPIQVTLSGSDPARGFGELTWIFRDRGAPGEQARSVYVAAVWEPQGWRITELRLMP